MARSVRTRIETRSARLRLPGRKDPYWQSLERELAAGYYRPRNGGAGTWWGRARVNGKYKIEALGTADDHVAADGEAVLNWAQAQAAIRAWAAKQTGSGPYTVADAVRDYLADLRARKGDAAAKGAAGRLNKHLLPTLGDKLLRDLTTAELHGWRNGMVREDGDEEAIRRSRDTAIRLRATAFAVFNLAFNTDLVADDRAWRRVKPFANVGEARKIILTDHQQQNLVDACEPDLREFALLVARTGARPGKELTEAKVRDLDLAHATLTVRGKTGAREIHLDPDALRQLRQLTSGKRPNDYLLTTAKGGPWTKSRHQRPVAVAVEKAGLSPDTTLYALRHTYISRALTRGADVGGVAKQCGTSIAMIQRFYGKWVPGDLARIAKKAAPKFRTEPATKVVALRTGTA
jgi:site-specific recombinase XerD